MSYPDAALHTTTLYSVDMIWGWAGLSVCPDALCHIDPTLCPSTPPSVCRSPVSLTTLIVHTKGDHNLTKRRKSVVVIIMSLVIDIIIDYS